MLQLCALLSAQLDVVDPTAQGAVYVEGGRGAEGKDPPCCFLGHALGDHAFVDAIGLAYEVGRLTGEACLEFRVQVVVTGLSVLVVLSAYQLLCNSHN